MRTFEDAIIEVVRSHNPDVDEACLRQGLADCDGITEHLADQEIVRQERRDWMIFSAIAVLTVGAFVLVNGLI